MEVLLELQPFLQLTIPDPPGVSLFVFAIPGMIFFQGEQDWASMRRAVERLRPVATATEDVEQDKAGLFTVNKYVIMQCGACALPTYPSGTWNSSALTGQDSRTSPRSTHPLFKPWRSGA
jgi:hypothetical protein